MVDPRRELITASVLDPAAKRWADRTADLLADFTLDVHGVGSEEHPFDEHLIYAAAWQLWCTGGKKPCWSKLDVHTLLASFSGAADDDEALRHHIAITLVAFFCFMVKEKKLTKRKARRVVEDLNPLWQKACSVVIADLARNARAEPQEAPQAWLN